MNTQKTYSELIKFGTFKERFEYLKLDGVIGEATFGFDRYLNQVLYNKDAKWKRVRNDIIIRDDACDLGLEGYPIKDRLIVHHMNPITIYDIENRNPDIYNPDYLICVSLNTHNAIHYGNYEMVNKEPIVRTANDTCPWRH